MTSLAILDAESLKVVGPAGALAVILMVVCGWALRWLIVHFKDERDELHKSHRDERKVLLESHRSERDDHKDWLQNLERRSEESQKENREALRGLTDAIMKRD